MIDEKKLIDELKQSGMIADNSYGNAMVDFINSQPKIGQWIPCSERLPEESLNSVIGWDEYRKRCCFVQYYDGKWHLGSKYGEAVKIIAWMPVPEPYKESD